ncbi:toll/interleukin-1 receptor domain-containing protein [Pseudonocardiaceae bacterium YIM PH 21723]|nr:toll/interleukin-1 receptor domain-containing protein [Pseudonocardiaceae bacterium YIM PH 21723]
MSGVFINYRTGDGEWAAALIKRELGSHFGMDKVFYASKSIRLGEDFAEEIESRLRRSDVLLAVIGPRWLTAQDRNGGRRLDSPTDWVRREVSAAFDRGIRVIPVLLDGIPPLIEPDLPPEITRLARCQYLRMHHRSDDFDLTRLLDELTDLVPSLTVPTASTRPAPSVSVAPEVEGELRSEVTRLRQSLVDPGGKAVGQDIVHLAAAEAVEAIGEHRYPVSMSGVDVPAVLEQRLTGYERDLGQLLRLVAVGACFGGNRHDELWISLINRIANRRSSAPPSSAREVWLRAESYPALLLAYTVGIAGMSAGREDLVYRMLTSTSIRAGRREEAALHALALRHVIDPQHAAEFPQWGGHRSRHALSRHLHRVLRQVFNPVLLEAEYDNAFEEYEYLRSLLELHQGAFTSLGEFAYQLHTGASTVPQRLNLRLGADSPLLRHGAFDGDPQAVVAARRQLDETLQGRYL